MIELLISSKKDLSVSKCTYEYPKIGIGRNADNTITLNESNISRYHAQINKQGNRYAIKDLGSANGTYVNGTKLVPNSSQILVDGDEISIGNFQLKFHTKFKDTEDLSSIPLFKPSATVVDGSSILDTTETLIDIEPISLKSRQSISIGRDSSNEITIDHPAVSRYHSRIIKQNSSFYILDLNSTNGVFVNGKQIKDKRVLMVGDTIRIGPCNFIFNVDETLTQDNEAGNLRLDAICLNKKVSSGINLLNNISLSIPKRQFVVIAGVSGGGKSTLVDALNGFRPATSGTVLVNGVDLYRNFNAYRTEIGYVPQKDIVHLELTVEEALTYAARLRMPADSSTEEIRQRVEKVMEDLGLSHRQKVQIKSLSGGQLKRVSIGVELLTQPSLFFLDEATSGLDPGTEADIMQLLRQLADSGCTIVLITHATENVMLCDLVVFLAKGGNLAYFGPPQATSSYFDVNRFNQIYHRVEREKSPQEWHQKYLESSYYDRYVFQPQESLAKPSEFKGDRSIHNPSPGAKIKHVSGWQQFFILSQRNLSILIRDRASLFLMLAIAPILGVLDIFTWQSKLFDSYDGDVGQAITMLFTTSLIAVMIGSLSTMREIVKEQEIYRRERTVGLQIFPYIFSKLWVGVLLALYQAAIFLLFKLLSVDIPSSPETLIGVYITLVLTTLAGSVMGLLVSTISPNQNIAPLLTIVFLVPQITFGGGVLPVNTFGPPGQLFNQFTLTKWSFESLVTITEIGRDVANDKCWSLSEPDRKNLTNKEKKQCTCLGKNLFKLCNFPEIKSKYDPAVDLSEPQKPPEPGSPPDPPQAPVSNSFAARRQYRAAFQNYQSTIKEYQEKVNQYQREINQWQQEYSNWKEKSQSAIGEAEGIINKYNQNYGKVFAVNLFRHWSILSLLIGMMVGLMLIVQKRKDVI